MYLLWVWNHQATGLSGGHAISPRIGTGLVSIWQDGKWSAEPCCVDLCGECAPTLKRQDYKQIEECLVRSLHDGIDASRLAAVENLRAVLSTAEKDLSTEEIERFISEGRVRLARWTPEKVKEQKNHYSKSIKIRFELKRERHIDKGAVMGSYI